MVQEATYRGTVYPWQCDHVGHMNIMWYVGKFDEANWNLFARLGLTPSYLRSSGRGMAAVQQNITYSRELLAGDIVQVGADRKTVSFLWSYPNWLPLSGASVARIAARLQGRAFARIYGAFGLHIEDGAAEAVSRSAARYRALLNQDQP